MKFSAVILVGGKSSRMGRDKAALQLGGQTLLQRQVEVVRQLHPEVVYVSGGDCYGEQTECQVLRDAFAGQGPLAGIEAALSVMTSPTLLVLAVDLPRMNLATLRWLVDQCDGPDGVVPRLGKSTEPLAALYPRAALDSLRVALKSGLNAARDFARECVAAGWVCWADVPADLHSAFTNCNSPEEWAALKAND